jgi:hypothetical protein
LQRLGGAEVGIDTKRIGALLAQQIRTIPQDLSSLVVERIVHRCVDAS